MTGMSQGFFWRWFLPQMSSCRWHVSQTSRSWNASIWQLRLVSKDLCDLLWYVLQHWTFRLSFFLVFLSFFILKFSNPDTISFRPQTLLWSVIDDASTKFHSREPITSPDRTFGFSVRGNGPSNTNSKFTCFNYHYAKYVLFSHLLERFFLSSFLSKNSKVITAQLATMISQIRIQKTICCLSKWRMLRLSYHES